MTSWLMGCTSGNQNKTVKTTDNTAIDLLANVDTTPETVVFAGLAENTYSLGHGQALVSGYDASMRPTLWLADAQNSSVTDLGIELPETENRSYGDSLVLPDGKVVILYQSTYGFSNFAGDRQTGTAHGFIVVDLANLNAIQDIPFTTNTNPEGLALVNKQLYVLCSNRNTDEPATILIFNSDYSLSQTLEIENAFNATDMALSRDQSKLLILCSGTAPADYTTDGSNGLTQNNNTGLVIEFDIANSTVVYNNVGGAFTDLEPANDSNTIYLTGLATDSSSGFGVLDLEDDSFTNLHYEDFQCDSSDLQDVGVGGQFFNGAGNSDGILRTAIVINNSGDTRVSFIAPDTNTCKSVEGQSALLTTPVIDIGSNWLVFVASGVDSPESEIASGSAFYSAVSFFKN